MINLKDYMFYMIDLEYVHRQRTRESYEDTTVRDVFNVVAKSKDEARAVVVRQFRNNEGFKIVSVSEVRIHAILHSIEWQY